MPFEYDGVMLVETNAHDHLFMLAHRRDVVHDGFHMLVFDDAVVTWRDETTIRVEAPGLTEDELLDAAASLVPVARE